MYESIGYGRSSVSESWARDVTESYSDSWMVATVLPEQFHSTSSNLYSGWPEAVLMHAVLEDAVNCVRYGLRATDRRK